MVDESVEADKVKETKKVRAVELVISLCHSVTTSDRFHQLKLYCWLGMWVFISNAGLLA